MIKQLRAQDWPVTPLDLGGAMQNARPQSQFKMETLLSALREMKYGGIAVGPEELRIGAGWLLSQDSTPAEAGKPDDGLHFLAANVTLFGTADLATPVRHRILTAGGLKIGVTAVFGNSFKDKLGTVDPSEIQIADPAAALLTAINALQAQKPDLLVLVSHATLLESQDLAKKFPALNVVFSTGPSEEPLADNPQQIGDTLLVTVGHKGKYVGLLGYYPDAAKQKYRFNMVRLGGDRFKDDPQMIKQMQLYQDRLKDENLVETEPALKHFSSAKFVGAEKCGECHTKAFAKWKETGHASAFESLKHGRLGISRIADPECIACHTVGWNARDVMRYESGYSHFEKTAHLKNVQCESCHGPGSKHIELIDADQKVEASKLVRVTLDEAKRKYLCQNCHDNDNSPKFEIETYWPKVAHPGKD